MAGAEDLHPRLSKDILYSNRHKLYVVYSERFPWIKWNIYLETDKRQIEGSVESRQLYSEDQRKRECLPGREIKKKKKKTLL